MSLMRSSNFRYSICVVSLAISPAGKTFAVLSRDKIIRLFDFAKGKLIRKYDESSQVYSANSKNPGARFALSSSD